MQHRYVGDVGDFGKYALINALAANDLRLGIIWYLNLKVETNRDGGFTTYEQFRHCDLELFHKLQEVRSVNRHITAVQSSKIFPSNTIFADAPLPLPPHPCYAILQRETQQRCREDWFNSCCQFVSDAELVFLDPDNGIATDRVKTHSSRARKYAFVEEIQQLWSRGQSVVLIQHPHRNSTVATQVSCAVQRLKECASHGFAMTFHAFTVRLFFVLPANEDSAKKLHSRALELISGPWNQRFRFIA